MSINTKKYIEEYIKIRDKNGKVIPLKLNEPQMKYYNVIKELHEQRKPIRIIILKARQMGFSTETESIIFKNVVTNHNYNAGIVAHKEDSTANLFNMSKRMLEYLPDSIKPEQKKSNAKELVFNNDKGTGLDSKMKCMTAGGKGIGRSDTFTALHLSELAFWEGDKQDILLGLLQAVPNIPESMVIIESTANGFDYFKELWDKAVVGENDFYPLFVGWNELKEYQMTYTGFELTEDEIELQTVYNLTLEQLTWRRWCIKNNCGGDIDKFKQEYPICPDEAFLSTGQCYFDKDKVIKRIRKVVEPIKRGSFLYRYENNQISNIRFNENIKGTIKIFEEPQEGVPYVLAGDTAGKGSDNFTAQVINNITGKQVAVLKQQYSELEYAQQVYCLGLYYNTALIGIETNFSTYPNEKLQEWDYPNLYIREKADTYVNRYNKSFGFKTTPVTRPLILGQLQEIVLEEIDNINDIDTLREMLTFIKNKVGRPEAEVGFHDDLVMALAIVYYIRTQQSFTIENKQVNKPKEYNPLEELFADNNNTQSDYGMKINII